MPWIVILFGVLVVPLGLISIILVILQPLLVGHWCFWCLLAAICMLIMIALTVDEVVAVVQYLVQVKSKKQPLDILQGMVPICLWITFFSWCMISFMSRLNPFSNAI